MQSCTRGRDGCGLCWKPQVDAALAAVGARGALRELLIALYTSFPALAAAKARLCMCSSRGH
jgi:hypothetical protein